MNRRTLIPTILFVALGAGTAGADTHCTTAEGEATYMERRYSGGPPPPPGFEIGRTEWTFQGAVMERSISCTPPESALPDEVRRECSREDEVHDEDLVVGFIPGSEITLAESSPDRPWEILRKYVVRMVYYRPSGKPLPGGLVRYDEFMICTFRQILAP